MLKTILLTGLLLISAAACTPAAAEEAASQNTESEEINKEEHNEEGDHDEDDHDEGDHNEGSHDEDDHDEDEHSDEHDEHDEHETDGESREHGAHEHGAAMLFIAWSGNELAIDLETPAYNVLGFEYAPSSDAEKALLDESVAALEAGDLLQFSPDADCTLISASVETELAEEAHEEHEDEAAQEDEEAHSDIAVSYNIQCEQPDNLESIDISQLFAQFPNFEDLRAQWISDTEQSAKALTADNPILTLR